MAIKLKFDESHNVIPPTLVLATRNGNKLGVVPAYNFVLKDTLQVAEMSFKVNKVEDGIEYALWNKLVDFKLAWVREWDTWFEIYVELDESNELVKCVTAKSLGEAELSQINLYGIEVNTEDDILRDDYEPTVFYDDKYPDVSLLNRLLYKAPHYKIGHVDDGLRALQRTFSFDGDSILDAFQTISEEIGCIFDIDSGSDENGNIARIINVYDLESYCRNPDCNERGSFLERCPACGSSNILTGYGKDTTIFISTENLADNITYSTDVGSVKNCFKLEAGDDLMTATVINCNPNGTAYIWYISDETKEDMSPELVNRLAEYDVEFEKYQADNVVDLSGSYLTEYNELVKRYETYLPELLYIKDSVVGYPELMTAYYDTIDFDLFLNHTLMPTKEVTKTTAKEQAEILKMASDFQSVSLLSLGSSGSVSESTATNAVLSLARMLINSKYQVKAINVSINGNTWSGDLVISSYYDNEEEPVTVNIVAILNDEYQGYLLQRLDKSVSGESDNVVGIVDLFRLSEGFAGELKKYGLAPLQIIKNCCQGCLNILVEQGAAKKDAKEELRGIYSNYFSKMSLIDSEIELRKSEIAIVTGKYNNNGYLVEHGMQSHIRSKITTIQNALDFEAFLGKDLWLEFAAYRREDTYKNDNYISDGLDNVQLFENALEFYNIAKKEIYKSATLQHSISASLRNLLVMPEFKPIVDCFEVGNWIRVRANSEVYRLRLIEYEIDFDNLENINIQFSDVMSVAGGMSDVESILDQASSMSSSYGMVAHQAGKGSKSGERLDNWVNKGLALTQIKIVNDVENQNITFDDQGLSCKEYLPITEEYDDRQLKLINRGIYLTDDGWQTCKVGVGNFVYYDPREDREKEAYGVIADTLVGDLILSETVGVYNKNGNVLIDKDGLTITSTYDPEKDNETMFTLQRKVSDLQGNETIEPLMYFDSDGELVVNGSVKIRSGNNDSLSFSDAVAQFVVNNKQIVGYVTENDMKGYLSVEAGKIEANVSSSVSESVSGQLTFQITTNDHGKTVSQLKTDVDELYLSGNKLVIDSTNFKVAADGKITSTGGTIGGFTILESRLYTGGHTNPGGAYVPGVDLNAGEGFISVGNGVFKSNANGEARIGTETHYILFYDGGAYHSYNFNFNGSADFDKSVNFGDSVNFSEMPTFPSAIPIEYGGTGATKASSARLNLGITAENLGLPATMKSGTATANFTNVNSSDSYLDVGPINLGYPADNFAITVTPRGDTGYSYNFATYTDSTDKDRFYIRLYKVTSWQSSSLTLAWHANKINFS